MIESDAYFSLAGVTYSQATAQLGSSSNNSASGNYTATQYGYDAAGRQDRILEPTGTIQRTVYDGLGRVVSRWTGTDDTPGSGFWSPTNNTSPSNMINVESDYYDTQSAPTDPTLSSSASGSLSATTYYVEITYIINGIETAGSLESSLSVAANHVLVVTAPSVVTGESGYNVYVSTTSGAEEMQNSSPVGTGSTSTEPTSGLISGAAVPLNGVGDSNLTEQIEFVGSGQAARVSQTFYDCATGK